VEAKLNDYHHLDPESGNHSELFTFSSLLYTKEEIAAYEEMILGNGAEKAVTRKFAAYYCSTTGECSPSRATTDFQWKKLVDPAEYLDEWYQAIKERIIWWGVIWACIDSILTMTQFFIKILIVLRNVGKRQLTPHSILKFVFMPCHELINLFPRIEDPAYGGQYVPNPLEERHELMGAGASSVS
jgi:hypothetical protein